MGLCVSKDEIVVLKTCLLNSDSNGEPHQVVDRFLPSERALHYKAEFNRSKIGVPVRIAWYATHTNGVAPDNYEIVAVDFPVVTTTMTSKATLPRPWPVGQYRVELYVDTRLVRSTPFEIFSEESKNAQQSS